MVDKLASYLYYKEMIGNIISLAFLGFIFLIVFIIIIYSLYEKITLYLYDRKEKKKNDRYKNKSK